jgi:hypothetical protein
VLNNRPWKKWLLIGVPGLLGCLIFTVAVESVVQRNGKAGTDGAPQTESSRPTGIGHDRYIKAVRAGVLEAPFNTTTVGAAFEGTFSACNWKSDESDKGVHFVEFTGRLKPETYREAFQRLYAPYQKCLTAPPPENPITVWQENNLRGPSGYRVSEMHDSNGNSCTADIASVVTCHDKDGKPFDENIAALPPDPKSCGMPPDEVVYSTVKFQFLFTADGQSFSVGYFDPAPWQNTSVMETTEQHGACIAHQGRVCVEWAPKLSLHDVMRYVYK